MRLWRWWLERLSDRETGEVLALFRMFTGAALIVDVGTVVTSGLVEVIWVDAAHGGYRTLGRTGSWLVEAFGGPTPAVVWTLVSVALLAGLLLVIGLGGRLTALVAAQAIFALSMINSHTKGSYDALLSNALWILVWSGSTVTWSLDCRLRTGAFRSSTPVASWPRRLAVFQLVVMYFFNGVQKVSADWTFAGGFSALYYILQQPTWQRFDMSWVAQVYPLTQLATFVTWTFEVGSPLLLLLLLWKGTRDRRIVRIVFAAVGVVLHLSIMVLLEVGAFSPIVLALYPCLFRPDMARLRRSEV